ncbi:MAG: leucine-rich repeat domain-containing protein [Clostridiales bacterium]|nr:leucine-rich repeat domain-containing protein [Clostridiales bacterium]
MRFKSKIFIEVSFVIFLIGIALCLFFIKTTPKVNIQANLNFETNLVNAAVEGKIDGAVENPVLDNLTFNDVSKSSGWNNKFLQFKDLSKDIIISFKINNLSTTSPIGITVKETSLNSNFKTTIKIGNETYTNGLVFLPEKTDELLSVEVKIVINIINQTEFIDNNVKFNFTINMAKELLTYVINEDMQTAGVKKAQDAVICGNLELIDKIIAANGKEYLVTDIEENAFENCTELTDIILPDTLLNIKNKAFLNCTSLNYNKENEGLYLGSKTNPYLVLTGTESKDIEEININQNCKALGARAFHNCKNLTNLTLPNGIKVLGYQSLVYCTSLTELILPNSITYLDNGVFGFATSLESITFPDSVEYIGIQTFYSCTSLKYVKLPLNLNKIPDVTFYNCDLLQEVIIPDNVKYIGGSAFFKCKKLVNINLPDSVEYIGKFAFSDCILIDVKLPKCLKELHKCAFQNCNSMTDVSLPSGLEYIGDYALNHCNNATNKTLTIPSTIKQIGGDEYNPNNPNPDVIGTHVFYDMATNHLQAFDIEENDYYMVQDGVLYRKDNLGNPKTIIAYPADKRDSKYEMPDTVVDAFELGLSRPFYLKEIVLSDNFVIYNSTYENLNNTFWGNNLAIFIYIYSGVTKITCKDTNQRYMSYNGAVYSKDGKTLYYAPLLSGLLKDSQEQATLNIKDGVTEIHYGSLGCDTTYKGNYAPVNNLDSQNHLKIYDKLYIPASVLNINESTITYINLQPWIIEIAEDNPIYKVEITETSGKTKYSIVKK